LRALGGSGLAAAGGQHLRSSFIQPSESEACRRRMQAAAAATNLHVGRRAHSPTCVNSFSRGENTGARRHINMRPLEQKSEGELQRLDEGAAYL